MFVPEGRDAMNEDERRRRLLLLRTGLVMCMLLVLSDSGHRPAPRPPREDTPAPRLPPRPSGIRFGPRLVRGLSQQPGAGGEGFHHNVSGAYKGIMDGERSFLQLSSVPIAGVPSVQLVYGLAKVLAVANRSKNSLYPLIGLLVSVNETSAYLTLSATPLYRERVALQVPVVVDDEEGDVEEGGGARSDQSGPAYAGLMTLLQSRHLAIDWISRLPYRSRRLSEESAGIEGAGIEGAGIDGAGIDGAGIEGAGIEGAGIEGAGIEGAGIEGAGIEGAGIDGAGIEGAGIEGAGIDGAGIEGAGIEGAGIEGAGIEGAGIDGAGIEGAGIEGAGIDGAGIAGVRVLAPVRGFEGLRLVSVSTLSIQPVLCNTSATACETIPDDALPERMSEYLYPDNDDPLIASSVCQYAFALNVNFSDRIRSVGPSKLASEMFGTSSSPSCPSFSIALSSALLTADLLDRKIQMYVTLAVAVCFSQIVFFVSLLRHSGSSGSMGKISILCLGSQALLDSLLCILHLMLCLAFNKFAAHFLTVSALELLLFTIFGMRCVVAVYQSRYAQEFAAEGSAGLRRRLAVLHLKFYFCLFVVIIFISYSYEVRGTPIPLLLLLHSVWVPQIVYSAMSGTRNAFNYVYLFGTAVSRLVLPLYIMGCPRNMFAIMLDGLLDSHVACFWLVAWTITQVAFICLQDQLGPRFFVPKMLLPARYNYHRALPSVSPGVIPSYLPVPASDIECGLDHECVICYCAVDVGPGSSEGYMVTPCDHVFHDTCLSRWMEVKLECPVCRASLPSVE